MTSIENRMDNLERKTSNEIKSNIERMKEDILKVLRETSIKRWISGTKTWKTGEEGTRTWYYLI